MVSTPLKKYARQKKESSPRFGVKIEKIFETTTQNIIDLCKFLKFLSTEVNQVNITSQIRFFSGDHLRAGFQKDGKDKHLEGVSTRFFQDSKIW